MTESVRPLCPVCRGTLVRFSVVGQLPCTSCDGGYMRGVTDPTDDELLVDELREQLGAERARAEKLEQLAMAAAFELGLALGTLEAVAR